MDKKKANLRYLALLNAAAMIKEHHTTDGTPGADTKEYGKQCLTVYKMLEKKAEIFKKRHKV